MTHKFVYTFCTNATGRNMSEISEKLLYHFHRLKRKTTQRRPNRVFKYIFKDDRFSSVSYVFLFRGKFIQSLSFGIRHTCQFSEQTPDTIHLLSSKTLLYTGSPIYKILHRKYFYCLINQPK
jgi:hypothetical protein